jgi:hypothetical protein
MSLIREALEKARREPPSPAPNDGFRAAAPVRRTHRAAWVAGGAVLAAALFFTALGAYWMGRNAPGEQGAQEGAQAGASRLAAEAASGGLKARTAEVEKRPVKESPAPASSSQERGSSQDGAPREGEGPREGAAAREGASRFSPGPFSSAAGAGSGANPAPEPTPAVLPRATTPAAPPQPADPVLRLEGIVGSASDPVAVINGSLVGVGDSVAGYRVLRIHGDQVEVARDGRTIVLKLR